MFHPTAECRRWDHWACSPWTGACWPTCSGAASTPMWTEKRDMSPLHLFARAGNEGPQRFHNHGPTSRTFPWLKVPTFKFKNLLRHYAKHRSFSVIVKSSRTFVSSSIVYRCPHWCDGAVFSVSVTYIIILVQFRMSLQWTSLSLSLSSSPSSSLSLSLSVLCGGRGDWLLTHTFIASLKR